MSWVTDTPGRHSGLPRPESLVSDSNPGEVVQSTQRLAQKQHTQVIGKPSRECRPLSHAAGELMRLHVCVALQTNDPHELAYFSNHS